MRTFFQPQAVLYWLATSLAIALAACQPAPPPLTAEIQDQAPAFSLPSSQGSQVSLSDYAGQPVLLYFHMANGWPPCNQQIVDLQGNPEFQKTGVKLVSIARDSKEELQQVAAEFGITDVPLLTDADTSVAEAYDVMQYALESGEPGHTFVLVGADGTILWVKDYGAPENPDRTMYVEPAEIIELINASLP